MGERGDGGVELVCGTRHRDKRKRKRWQDDETRNDDDDVILERELEREGCLFLVFFYADRRAAGKCRGKKWTLFFSEEIDKERGRGGKKFEREPTHNRLATSPPSMPHLITHIEDREGKKGSSSRTPLPPLLPFSAPRRAAPHRAWDDLLAWRPPPFREEIKRGVGGGRRAFLPAALRPARRPPAPLPPGHGRVDGTHTLLQGCHLGCHDAGMLQPLLF